MDLEEAAEFFQAEVTVWGVWFGQRYCQECGHWERTGVKHVCPHSLVNVADLDRLRPFTPEQVKAFDAIYAARKKKNL